MKLVIKAREVNCLDCGVNFKVGWRSKLEFMKNLQIFIAFAPFPLLFPNSLRFFNHFKRKVIATSLSNDSTSIIIKPSFRINNHQFFILAWQSCFSALVKCKTRSAPQPTRRIIAAALSQLAQRCIYYLNFPPQKSPLTTPSDRALQLVALIGVEFNGSFLGNWDFCERISALFSSLVQATAKGQIF